VRTNVPGAQVYRDGTALGPAPVDARYDYTGYYEFRAVAPGYEPLVQRVKFQPKWYDYPGLDLIAEYVHHSRREQGRDYDAVRSGVQSRVNANVFIIGSRLAF